jgi:hypothetical protein
MGGRMAWLLIALDPGAAVRSAGLAAAWNADGEALVPLLVNVGSSVIYDPLKRLVGRLVTAWDGDRVVVVRTGGMPS